MNKWFTIVSIIFLMISGCDLPHESDTKSLALKSMELGYLAGINDTFLYYIKHERLPLGMEIIEKMKTEFLEKQDKILTGALENL